MEIIFISYKEVFEQNLGYYFMSLYHSLNPYVFKMNDLPYCSLNPGIANKAVDNRRTMSAVAEDFWLVLPFVPVVAEAKRAFIL